ncbi:MAG: hypothetical protein MJ252_24025, partial [archaeon]|nr:hypothetical protein [archaeon]
MDKNGRNKLPQTVEMGSVERQESSSLKKEVVDKRDMQMLNDVESKENNEQPSILATEGKNNQEPQPKPEGEEDEEPVNLEEGELLVDEFDAKCEKHFRMKKVVPLEWSTCKIILFVLLNICTAGLINLVIVWFPKIELGLKYSKCDIKQAVKMGIYGSDGEFYVVEVNHLTLPDIGSSPLKKFCYYRVGEGLELTYFKFKLFNYIYYDSSKTFKSFEYYIKETQQNIVENLTNGLKANEIEYQKGLFGICDLIVIIPSVFKLLFIEFADPFYLFQIFSIVLWYCTNYEYYASVIVVCTVVSIATAVYESRVNLVSIKQMARYACKINVTRQNEDGTKKTEEMMSTELVPGDLFE